jgi:hypothetical protein
MIDKILTAEEVAQIRGRFHHFDVEALCDSHETLRRRHTALSESLVHLRGAARRALETDQSPHPFPEDSAR